MSEHAVAVMRTVTSMAEVGVGGCKAATVQRSVMGALVRPPVRHGVVATATAEEAPVVLTVPEVALATAGVREITHVALATTESVTSQT
jgi:hypothetical protein